ncbi:chaperone protein dnaJ 20, chloroplastic-like [Juglans microcarpa x Juglans regia]|uniref:chaperone protein dnaJ 20, chloroplastic-like n=1 Tax=Juglans microcarpa x Juglans regia TaxID=2249226 RepID=UPI001B7EA96C|nr:chaperone protein dnaJ 20, chloroplastic-like [Juglans microcarpa x Juglans regia]
MRCYGLTPIHGSECRFFYLNATRSIPIPRPNSRFLSSSVNLFPSKLVIPSPRTPACSLRATINDVFVTDEAAGLSFYDLLGIPESGSLVEIKQAYKKLARMYHPDVSPPGRVEEYTKRFIRVQEAYEILSDPRRRALYDRDLARGLHLAFSARTQYQSDEGMEERNDWRNRWQSQLSKLKRRSQNRDAGGDLSWGARMRRRRDELANEL